MLSSETKVVTYVNKKGERSTYPLNTAMESSNLEMVKRLKYTKDILTHMLNANAAGQSKPNMQDPTAGGKEMPSSNVGNGNPGFEIGG
jgi:polo-like kinase 1